MKSTLNMESILYLEKIIGIDKICSILGKYIDSYTEVTKNLSVACDENNTQKIRQLAHSFKSSSIQVGADKLSSMCEELENNSNKYDFKRNRKIITDIEAEFDVVSIDLANVIERYKKSRTTIKEQN